MNQMRLCGLDQLYHVVALQSCVSCSLDLLMMLCERPEKFSVSDYNIMLQLSTGCLKDVSGLSLNAVTVWIDWRGNYKDSCLQSAALSLTVAVLVPLLVVIHATNLVVNADAHAPHAA